MYDERIHTAIPRFIKNLDQRAQCCNAEVRVSVTTDNSVKERGWFGQRSLTKDQYFWNVHTVLFVFLSASKKGYTSTCKVMHIRFILFVFAIRCGSTVNMFSHAVHNNMAISIVISLTRRLNIHSIQQRFPVGWHQITMIIMTMIIISITCLYVRDGIRQG